MVALAADGSASRPPHPTMPPYPPRKILSYQQLLNFNTRRRRLPPQRPILVPGSQFHVDPHSSSSTPSAMTSLTTATPPVTLSSPSLMIPSSTPLSHVPAVHVAPHTTTHSNDQHHPPINQRQPPAATPTRPLHTITYAQHQKRRITIRNTTTPGMKPSPITASSPPTPLRINTVTSNTTPTKIIKRKTTILHITSIDHTATYTTTLNSNHTHLHLPATQAVPPPSSYTDLPPDTECDITCHPMTYEALPITTSAQAFPAHPASSPTNSHSLSPCPPLSPASEPVPSANKLTMPTTIHMSSTDDTATIPVTPINPNPTPDNSATPTQFQTLPIQQYNNDNNSITAMLVEFHAALARAQQEFDEKLQQLQHHLAQRSTPTQHPAYNQQEPHTQQLPHSPLPQTNQLAQQVTTVAATPLNLSPLNTNFLLPTGDYNAAANGVPWFTASLFPFLPIKSTISRPTIKDKRSDCIAYCIHSVWLPTSSRTHACNHTKPMLTRPTIRAHTNTLQPTDSVTVDTYCPPWPPPNLLRGLPTIRPLNDFRPDILWPTRTLPHDSWVSSSAFSHRYINFQPGYSWPVNPDQSGHQRLSTRHMRPVSQASNSFVHPSQFSSPLQYRILYTHWVSPPTSMTEDKNLLRPP